MKVLYLITGLGGGGAEKVVVELAEQMFIRGHQVKIAYLKGVVVVQPKYKEIELIYLGFENLKTIYAAYNNYKELITIFKPDVVHAHMVHANIFARVTRKFQPIPKLICTAHSNNEGGKLRMLAYKFTHSLADLTTNVSRAAARNFEVLGAVPKGEIETVYNGIDLDRFKHQQQAECMLRAELALTETTPIFLAVGRLHEAKDYPNLIRAFARLKENIKQSVVPKLVIAGDGDLKKSLEKMAIDFNITENVIFLGRRDDIPSLMAAADVFVLSSIFEGFGLVVAEAMACETFVIATDCGGVKEVMGEHGILVQPNSAEKLTQAFIDFMQMDTQQIIDNNKKALNYIQHNFDLENIVNQWLEIYAA